MIKTLLNSPDLNLSGGVASFCAMLKGCFQLDVDFFTTGPRLGESNSAIAMLIRMFKDYLHFFSKLSLTDYDIVHLNPSLNINALARDAGFLLIAKWQGKKCVVFFHGWNPKFAYKIQRQIIWRLLFCKIFFLADAFIVLCKDYKQKLHSMGYTGPVYCCKTAVDNLMMALSKPWHRKVRSKEEPFNILFLSRIEKEKGIFEALESYRLLKSVHPNAVFLIAGEGSQNRTVKKYIENKKIEDVRLLGFVKGEKKAAVFKQAHCFLLPSYHEGMPISVLEAMLFGLPVITRAVGGLNDFFIHNKMGFITLSRSPDIFFKFLTRLIDDPLFCQKTGRFNNRYVNANFKVVSATKDIESVYMRTYGRTKPSRYITV